MKRRENRSENGSWIVRYSSLMALAALIVVAALNGTASTAPAQVADRTPDPLEGVGIDQRLDAQLPLDLEFTDDRGRSVRLGDYFTGQRPVILTLSYSDCPMLCHLLLDGLVDTMRQIPWTLGQEFEVVNVSINPKESVQRARETKQKYLKDYGRKEGAAGWHFLVGREENIRQLADAVGFHYTYIAETKQYAHAAGLMICTPEGRVSRYLFGIDFPPQTLRLSLVEASDGKIGSTLDQALLFCFHYDAEAGRYGPAAQSLMKLGATVTLCVVLIGLVPYWMRRKRATAGGQAAAEPPAATGPDPETANQRDV